MKSSLRGAGRIASNPQLPRGDGIWITDDVLASTFQRFIRTSKRCASHVPGPLEARRRLAKRRMVGLAHPTSLETPTAESVIGWIWRTWKNRASMRYEPPWPTQTLARPLEQSGSDTWNTVDHMRWINASAGPGESISGQSTHNIAHADIAIAPPHWHIQGKEKVTVRSPAHSVFDLRHALRSFEEKLRLLLEDTCLDLRQVTVLLKETVQDIMAHTNGLADELAVEQERSVKLEAFSIVLRGLRLGNLHTRNLRDLFSWISPLNVHMERDARLSLLRVALSELKLRLSNQQDANDVLDNPRHLYVNDLRELGGSDLLLLFSHLSGQSGSPDGMTALRAFLNESVEAAGTFAIGVKEICCQPPAPEHTISAFMVHNLSTFVRAFVHEGLSSFIAEVTRLVIVYEDSWNGSETPKILDFWLRVLQGVPNAGQENCYSQIPATVWDVLAEKREPVQLLQAIQHLDNTRLAWIILRHWAIRNIGNGEQGIVAVAFLKRWEDTSYRRKGRLDMFRGLLKALSRARLPIDLTIRYVFDVLYLRIASKDDELSLLSLLVAAPRKYTVSDKTVAEIVKMLAASDLGLAFNVAEKFALSASALSPELLIQAASLPEPKGHWVRHRLFQSRSLGEHHSPKASNQGQTVCSLSSNFVEVVEMVALTLARNTHYTNRAAYWNVMHLHEYLEQHHTVMSATMARALVHAGIVRFIEDREYLSHHRLMDVAHKVSTIEGPETAHRLVRKVEMIRGRLDWHKRYITGARVRRV